MAATSTSPVKILLDLGIDLDNLSSEENYLSALMEGAAAIESATKGKGDGRSAILREEVIRVRKGRKAADPNFKQRGQSFKITKKNISAQKLLTSSKEAKAQTEGGGDLLVIKEKVVAIEALLGEQYKLQEENAKDAKQEAEQKRRSLKERLLEGSGKVFDGVKKATNTVLKPFQSVWENIIGFIKKIILGRVLFKILEWTSDPKNAGKIESIFKFLGDWWPALLAAYLVFGNGLSKFVIGLTGKLVVLGAKLVAKVIPALIKAAAAMGPWGLAAAGVAAVGAGAYMMTRGGKDESEGENAKEAQDMGVLSMNTGGPVPGSGNTDTVPAMLTPGEFVMSKGAVQRYGVNALEGMNAAAGGTNKPTLLRGYNEGGAATPMSMEDLVIAAGPSLVEWMEGHNPLIDSDPDAIYGEHMRMELDRDGKMINFGKTIANMSEWAFNTGVEQLSNNEAIDPDIKEALLKKMAWVRKETLENPNFKSDMAFNINKDIPGTAANRLYLRAQNDPNNIAIKAGIPPEEVAKLWNRRGMSGGGLVQGFKGGGGVHLLGSAEGFGKGKAGSKKFSGAQLKGLLDSQKGIGATSIKKIPTIPPPITAPKVTVVNQPGTEEVDSSQTQLPTGGNREIPSFDATLIRSSHKMEVLGISA